MPYLVVQLLQGESLQTRLDRLGQLPFETEIGERENRTTLSIACRLKPRSPTIDRGGVYESVNGFFQPG